MKLLMTIELGNDAMQTPNEAIDSIVTALRAQVPAYVPFEPHQAGTFRDPNGNTVGKWEVEA